MAGDDRRIDDGIKIALGDGAMIVDTTGGITLLATDTVEHIAGAQAKRPGTVCIGITGRSFAVHEIEVGLVGWGTVGIFGGYGGRERIG